MADRELVYTAPACDWKAPPFEVLSTTQILAGKLLNRLSETPARDLDDLVVAGREDRDGLEQAVNMLGVETQAEAAAIRGMETSRYESLEIEPAKAGQPARVVTTTRGREPRAIAIPRTRILEASWVGSITVRPVEEARRHRARPG